MVNLVIYTLGHWSVLIAFSPFSPSLLLATLTALPKVTKHMGLCVLVAQLCPTLCNLMDVAHQAPLSKEFSRQEYWNELPFPSPEDLPDPGIEPRSPALQADSLPTEQ